MPRGERQDDDGRSTTAVAANGDPRNDNKKAIEENEEDITGFAGAA